MLRNLVEASARNPVFVALGIATLVAWGVYAVVSYITSQLTHEIGIRMAIGARRADILLWVLRRGLIISLAGLTAWGADRAVPLYPETVDLVAAKDPAAVVRVLGAV